jgi:hypothetical protein
VHRANKVIKDEAVVIVVGSVRDNLLGCASISAKFAWNRNGFDGTERTSNSMAHYGSKKRGYSRGFTKIRTTTGRNIYR